MYPKIIKPYVLSFCRRINQNEPVWVEVRPLPGKPFNECFSIVQDHIVLNGGKQYNGWAIWEWRKVMIEAEFHCVWERPDGQLVDLTPKAPHVEKILFLPDPQRSYTGRQVNNIRKALSRDKDIDRFIQLANDFFVETNRIVATDYYGEIIIEGRALEIHDEKERLQSKLLRRYGLK